MEKGFFNLFIIRKNVHSEKTMKRFKWKQYSPVDKQHWL